jgi:multicomponent Na+:H+ antiporter subunit B
MTEALINMVLLTLMAAVTIGIIRLRNLFGVVILSGIYSFLMASVMMVLDAVDVAMTEASVGAGISTVLLLTVLYLTKSREMVPLHQPVIPLFLAIGVAVALMFGSMDLPPFGAATTPVNESAVSNYYLQNSVPDTGIVNVVTSVLASYRGFDTLGEVTVVFIAGIGVLTLLRGRRKKHAVDTRKTRKGASA